MKQTLILLLTLICIPVGYTNDLPDGVRIDAKIKNGSHHGTSEWNPFWFTIALTLMCPEFVRQSILFRCLLVVSCLQGKLVLQMSCPHGGMKNFRPALDFGSLAKRAF